MSQVCQIIYKNLEEIIHKLSFSCCLSILPTAFFQKVLPVIASDLIQIIHISLDRCFPPCPKTSNYQTTIEKEQLGQVTIAKLQSNLKPSFHK